MTDTYSNPLSFIFGTKPGGTVPTYEQLQTRRKIAAAMMSQAHPYPKTVGEGLGAIGDALGARGYLNSLETDETARGEANKQELAGFGIGGGSTPAATPTTAPPVSAPVTPPVATPDAQPTITPPPVVTEPTPMPTPVPTAAVPDARDAIATALTPTPAAVPAPVPTQSPPPITPAPPQTPQIRTVPPSALPQVRAPTSEPIAPVRPGPTPMMLRLQTALTQHGEGDPVRPILLNKLQQEQQDQEKLYAQQQEEFTHKRDLWENAPLKQQELTKAAMDAQVTQKSGGLGNEALLAPVIKSADTIKGLPSAAQSLNGARDMLAKGTFTGNLANQQMAFYKTRSALANMFGISADDPRVSNTETFKATIMPMVAQARAATSGNANISDADIKLAMQAAGGEITLDAKTFPRVLDALERINTGLAMGHQQRVLSAGLGIPERQQTLQGNYGIPYEQLRQIIPQKQIEKLRAKPETADEFDTYFSSPGLAKHILGTR